MSLNLEFDEDSLFELISITDTFLPPRVTSREEQEKLNVWVALLNLENMYGNEETLKNAFERALQFCEPMPVYQQLADIYTKSEKIKV